MIGGGRVMVQFLGTEGLFSIQARGLAGSKLLWCTELTHPETVELAGSVGNFN